jgi:RNA polymerase sigma-70 factor (ECF subfamily)
MVPDDSQLESSIVERLSRRDPSGLTDAYDRYSTASYSLLLRITRNSAVAEDLLQELFLRVWNRSAAFDSTRGHLGVWIMAIARNLAIDHLRSAQVRFDSRIRPIEQTDYSAISYKQQGAETILDNSRTVSEAFSTLNENQRRVLEMAYFEGFSQAEIAKRLAEPLGTVKSWMRSALARLRFSIASGGVPK